MLTGNREREGNDLQHRSLAGFEPGTLQLCGICSNQSTTMALLATSILIGFVLIYCALISIFPILFNNNIFNRKTNSHITILLTFITENTVDRVNDKEMIQVPIHCGSACVTQG